MPTLSVEIAFSAGANPAAWTLDVSPFPVTLGDALVDVYTDVSADVRGLNISRGKSRELDQFQAGRCVVNLDNRTRDYDPLNLSGPYVSGGATQIKPGRRIRVSATHPITAVEYDLYHGTVRDWQLDYTGKFDAVTTPMATDLMTELANTKVSVTTSAAASGTAVGEVLANAAINAYDADTGSSTLQAMTFTGTALEALRVIEQTEQGFLFVERDGVIRFIERLALLTETRHSTSQATFGSGNLTYEKIQIAYESDVIKNHAVVTRTGGSAQDYSDETSITDYGERLITLSNMASSSDTEALALANFLVEKWKDPAVRVRQITFHPRKHSDLMTQALARRLLDRVTVEFAPVGGGTAISQELWIIGIQHDFKPADMSTTFTFAPTDYLHGWMLDVSHLDSETILTY